MASDFHSHVCKSGAVTLLSVPYPEPGGGWPWSLEFHPWHLPETVERIADICAGNLRSFLAGEPLKNLVDRTRGY